MRVGLRTLIPLLLCAAFAAAAVAHYAIDVIGDYALAHDTYDDVAHSSRGIVSGIALLLALALALRGLQSCCELAAAYRGRLPTLKRNWREAAGFVLAVAVGAALLVPAMECMDGRLAGLPVHELDVAFGGSIVLGLSVSVICAASIGLFLYVAARWLISHRDAIATMIAILLRAPHANRFFGRALSRHLLTPRRRRTPHALRLCKRGPPRGGICKDHHTYETTEGDSRDFRIHTRVVRARCARDDAALCRTRERGTSPCAAG